ncbi:MAG: hypothetical protein CK425_08065 [Parachlamydia sp.]|nr:MAG: hypothetical protein CK425_08065 [Parachlamydia sp.]
MNPVKRKHPENYIKCENEDKRLKTDASDPLIPVEVWIRIGGYLDDHSRLNLSSISKDFEVDNFWSDFDRRGPLHLKDLNGYPPKLRYFFKKKLLALMAARGSDKETITTVEENEIPNITFAEAQAKKYLVSNETQQNKDSLSLLKCHLSDIFCWSTTEKLLGQGRWPDILNNIATRVIQPGSTPFENLVAGWVAAHKNLPTAKSYFSRTFKEKSIDEVSLIACSYPLLYNKSERIKLAAQAARKGYFLTLETLLIKLPFKEKTFNELKEYPPTLAWKAKHLFGDRDKFKKAAKYYDQALQGYIEKSPDDFSTSGPVLLETLEQAIITNSHADENKRVCDLYEVAKKIYAAKNLPIPNHLLYTFAWSFFDQSNYKKTILLIEEWLKGATPRCQAFYLLCYSYDQLDEPEKALANGRLAIETYRNRKKLIPPDTLVLVGNLETHFDNNTSALDCYVEAEKGFNQEGTVDPDFLFEFAKFYKKINHLDSSLEYLEKARLAFQTSNLAISNEVYLEMALVFDAQDEQEKALQSYLKITINFEEVHEEELLENYAKISVKFSKLKEALASYRAIVKGYNTRTQALPEELYEDISLVIRQVENNPPLPEVLLALGKLYLELNEKDKAFASLESFFQTTNSQTQHSPEFAETAQDMAVLCWQMQKIIQGLEYINLAVQAYEQGTVPARVYEIKANFHYMHGDFVSASDFFRQAFEAYEKNQVNPDLKSLWIAALTEKQLGHLDKCLLFLRLAVKVSQEIAPPDPNLHLNLAMALQAEGQDGEAAEAYYFAIRDRKITIPISTLEKAAELSFKIKKISYALYFYKFILGAYVENKLLIPAEILERVKDLNDITSHTSLKQDALIDLMWINEYTEDLEKAASALELFLEKPNETGNISPDLARQKLLAYYVSLQNHDKVFEITDQVHQRHLVSVSVPFDLYKACGKAHLKLDHPDIAAKFFAFAIHALELPPYHKQPLDQPCFELHCLVGCAHEKMGQAAKAVEIYNKAVEIYNSERTQPQSCLSPSWLREIAKKNSDFGNIEQAIFCYEEACRVYMTKKQAIPLKILTELEKMVQGRTDFTTKALFCLAEIYFKFGKFEKAIRYYKMNIYNAINKKSEYYYNSIFNLALCYEAQGKLKKAVKFYKLAHDVFNSLELPIQDILSKLSDLAPKIH